MSLRLNDFEYELPEELIAQHPAPEREGARLLVHNLAAATSEHRQVRDLLEYLDPGDLLVVNNTRVVPSRLFGRRASGGRVELFLLEPHPGEPGRTGSESAWLALVNPARKLKPGERIELEGGRLSARMLRRELDSQGEPRPEWTLELEGRLVEDAGLDTLQLLERHGHIPLPPYIERPRRGADDAEDRERYQTVFAQEKGAVAAPTAGLHLSLELLQRIREQGVSIAEVTLHVGAGTFQPVKVGDVTQHQMHAERYTLGEAAANEIDKTRERGGRVIAVGTTSVRVLETCASGQGRVQAGSGSTRLFLYPGREFQVVDALFTNFHLPHSSLLMLVSAFAGTERVLEIYRDAVARRYRFFSYGDAMLLHSRA